MKQGSWLFLMVLLCFGTHSRAAENQNSGLGLNLTGIAYWSSQWMLLDVMKQASNGSGELWATSNANTFEYNTGHQEQLQLDSAGWPVALPSEPDAEFHYVTTIIYHDNEHNPVGDFVVLYEGEGELEYVGPTLIESTPGRDVVRLQENQFFHLRIISTDPNDSGDYLRNIRIIVPGGSCSEGIDDFAQSPEDCASTEDFIAFEHSHQERVFHPLFIADVASFRTLRFMQFLATINNPIVDWAHRPQLNDASWALEGGAPLELALMLANKVQAEPWLNIPVRADDSYLQSYIETVHTVLDENLNFYLELGNEIWNNAWPYNLDAEYMAQQGEAMWPGASEYEIVYRLNYYGMRSYQTCQIAKQQFAPQAARVNCVMGGQTGVPWISGQALECPLFSAQNGTSCAQDMDVLAVGNYFAGYLADDRYKDILLQWSESGEEGLDNLFNEFYSGVLIGLTYEPDEPEWWQAPPEGALHQAREHIAGNLALAERYNLMLAAYESGQHLTYAGYGAEGREQISNDLFLPANRDPRMAQAYRDYLNQWIAAGGGLNVLFESTGRWDQWGAFPLKESQLQTDSVKFNAVMAFNELVSCWWANCERAEQGDDDDNDSDTDTGNSDDSDQGDDNDNSNEAQILLTVTPLLESMGVALAWESDLSEDAVYQVYRDGSLIWSGQESSYAEHWLTLNHDFSYQVMARDFPDYFSEIVVTQAGDSQAPSAVTELSAEVRAGQVTLTWLAATDNVAIYGYKIHRNGEPYGWVEDLNFVDQWPSAQQLKYQISAIDESGNEGPETSIEVTLSH